MSTGSTAAAPGRAAMLGAVAAGAVLGSLARYGLGVWWPHQAGGFPWSTVTINVGGSAMIGLMMAMVSGGLGPALLRPFAGSGVLGGFTTFSTAMLDGRVLVAGGHPVAASVSVLVTWVAALGAVWLGWRGGRVWVDRRSVRPR